MAMTLRLDEQHDALLEALAERLGRSKTDVVALALDELAIRADRSRSEHYADACGLPPLAARTADVASTA